MSESYNVKYSLILFILAIIILSITIYINRNIISINGWPSIKNNGKILMSYVQDDIVDNSIKYKPIVIYEYSINNSIFRSNNIVYSGSPWFDKESEALKYVNEIRDKDKYLGGIDIIYNPLDLKKSFLIYPKQNMNGYYASFFFLLISIIVFSRQDYLYK